MKAAIYPGHGKPITIQTLADPEPGPGDIVLRVHRCGICGTDLSMTKGEMFDFGPGQFGHEYAGEIVAIGKGVEHFAVSEKICVIPSLACGACSACDHGNNVLCKNVEGRASVGFSEYARIPESVAVKLPNTLSFADGALIEPLAVSLYGVRQSTLKPGDDVLVLGGGTVALFAIYWARRMGARRIVALSRDKRRAEFAKMMGADAFIESSDDDARAVSEALGRAPDMIYECVGAPGMLAKAVAHCGPFGKIMSLGFCTAPDPILPALCAMKCITLQFAVGYGMNEFLYIADQMDKGHVDPKTIVTNQISLEAMPAMFDRLRGKNEETKVHVLP